MGEKDGKKRKRQTGPESSSKKVAVEGATSAGHVKVNYHDSGLHPVLLDSPGLTTPDLPFKPYAKPVPGSKSSSASTARPSTHDLLLHSSKHPRLDYTASPAALDQHLSHYLAVYDSATQQLQITPAHHLSLRSNLRSEAQEKKKERQKRTAGQQREDLGREFGTKKAKKAILDKTYNAIDKDGAGKGKKNDTQSAVLDAMADSAAAAPKQDDLAASLASKPIPKPNLAAESPEDVYSFNTLIPPSDARLIPIKDWQDTTRADEPIDFRHRFPAFRVSAIGKSDNTQRLKALRYLLLLLEFHDVLGNAGKTGKKVPKKDVMAKKLAAWPEALVDGVRRRFSNPQNELPKWHLDNLYTHMCALSLFIDGWTTDTSNLKDDMRMENKEIVPYFRELGAKVAAPTEKEREVKGLSKAQAAAVRMARLKVPLDFPKPRVGRKT